VSAADDPFVTEVGTDSADSVRRLFGVQTGDLARRYLWRGQSRAEWGLAPSLFRRLLQLHETQVPTEDQICAYETDLMKHAIGRGWSDGTHASTYAKLQHHGAATRFLDVTHDAMVALWFAVEDSGDDSSDAAVFAIDVTGAKVFTAEDSHGWSDFTNAPTGQLGVFQPPWSDERAKSQRASFIWTRLTGAETRNSAFGMMPGLRLGTRVVIPAAARPALRVYLEDNLGIHAESLFPDFDGFAVANSVRRAFRRPSDQLGVWG
jgi:hypothetical protein